MRHVLHGYQQTMGRAGIKSRDNVQNYSPSLAAASVMKVGDQYSVSSVCLSTHTNESAMRSSIAATALARSQLRFICSMDTVTYPNTCIASSTAD